MDQPETFRKLLFDGIAETYDRIRPIYPDSMVNDLIESTGISEESRILEIGSGTGQLTGLLARRGLNVTALEMGRNLAYILKKKLEGYPGIRVINQNFESYSAESGSFDLVVAATSFHWLDRGTRIKKIGELLDRKGKLAIFETHNVKGGTEKFFEDSQKCYKRWDPGTIDDYHLPSVQDIRTKKWEEEVSGAFRTLFSGTYEMEKEYDSRSYADLLKSYSDILAMDQENRDGIIQCMGNLIESGYGGKISKKYLMELYVAEKV